MNTEYQQFRDLTRRCAYAMSAPGLAKLLGLSATGVRAVCGTEPVQVNSVLMTSVTEQMLDAYPLGLPPAPPDDWMPR